jgi:hypothetical protein
MNNTVAAQLQVTEWNGTDVAKYINECFARPALGSVTVNGRVVGYWPGLGKPASCYNNGTVAVSVEVRDRSKTRSRYTQIFIKIGETATVVAN